MQKKIEKITEEKIIKKLNKTDYQILEKIMKNNKMSRIDLSRELDLTPAAISKAIKKLSKNNLIKEKSTLMSTGGRPKTSLKINENYKKIIGINLGVGFIRVAISDLNGNIIKIEERKFAYRTQEKVLNLLDDVLTRILNEYDKSSIISIGLATHGMVDRKKGMVINSPHFKWKNLEIRKEIEKKYNIPVIVENDVRAMLMAEYRYRNIKSSKNAMLLYIKNGVGAAIYLNGEIYEGSNWASGEIGHYIVNENSTIQCRCGKYGCLETEYSEQAIINKIIWLLEKEKISVKNLDIETVYEMAKEKQNPYYSIIKESAYETGKVVGNILNIIDVNNIIIAGDIVMTGEVFIENFKKGIGKMLLKEFSQMVKINITELDDNIGVYGAISLITSNLFTGEKLLKL